MERDWDPRLVDTDGRCVVDPVEAHEEGVRRRLATRATAAVLGPSAPVVAAPVLQAVQQGSLCSRNPGRAQARSGCEDVRNPIDEVDVARDLEAVAGDIAFWLGLYFEQ
jgi:hypothetical protein